MDSAADWTLDAVVRGRAAPAHLRDPFSFFPLFPPPPPISPADCSPWELEFVRCAADGCAYDFDELRKALFPPPPLPPPPAVPAPRRAPARAKRGRKSQLKKVVQKVPAEGVTADVWAWRKYGQKPIKGSPFPRGYYRCSSSKGCPARKQVERCRTETTMFIVTYTGEHCHAAPAHKNSLAGSTRLKAAAPSEAAGTGNSESGLSPTTPLASSMEEEEDEEELTVEDMDIVGDDEELIFLDGTEDMAAFFSSGWASSLVDQQPPPALAAGGSS